MKNRSIIIISVLFGLLLVGIILIQNWWVDRAEKLNQKSFDDAVYKSLGAVVKQIEEKENFVFIKGQIANDTLIKETKKLIKKGKKRRKPKIALSGADSKVFVHVSSGTGKESKTVVRIEKNDNGIKTIENNVYVGAGAMAIPPVPPVPPVPINLDDKIENIEVLVEKMSHVKDLDSISLKPAEIEEIITEQLKQNNLPKTFSFCLLSKDPKKSFVPKDKPLGIPYRINLYPNDLFGREVTLAVFFRPEDYTTGKKDWYLPQLLSLVFTVSLLLLFAYSIRMIIKHRRLLEMKNDFINHMSHEFKTPLAGISLGADMLIDKPEKMSPEQIDKVARIIRKQSALLDKEVTGVLLNAQLEENIKRDPAPFNVANALKAQVDLFALRIENKKAKVETRFDNENIVLVGDEMLWQKVFSNLLDNALKFSKEDPEIKISLSGFNGTIKIEFSDNGIGVSEKDLPHIFEKFYRSNYYKQSNIRGFGLGLSFVKKVVDSHKGTIRAESELGKGTKIIIEINV